MQSKDEYGRLCNLPSCGHELRRHQAQEGMCQDCKCYGWVPNLQDTEEIYEVDGETGEGRLIQRPKLPVRNKSWMEQAEIAMRVMRSEPFMWLMVGSGHPEAQLAALRPLWKAYRAAGGKHWGDKNVKGI